MTGRCLLVAVCVTFGIVYGHQCKDETIMVPDFEVKHVNFRHEGGFESNLNCVWTFKGKNLLMQLMDLYMGSDDAVYLYDGPMTQNKIVEKDDDGAQANTKNCVIIKSEMAVLRFVSGDAKKADEKETGFSAFAIAGSDKSGFKSPETEEELNLTATEQKQIVTSPGFPNKYPLAKSGKKIWTWNIKAEGATSITLSFIYMDISTNADCGYHVIEFYGHGMSANSTKLCFKNNWDMSKYTYNFSADEIHLKFLVDQYDSRQGFVAEYSAVLPGSIPEPEGSTPKPVIVTLYLTEYGTSNMMSQSLEDRRTGGCDVLNCIVPIVVIVLLVIVAIIIVVVLVRKRKSKKYKPTETSEEKTAMPLSEDQEQNEQETEEK